MKKIAIGNSVFININNSILEIERIEIQDTINSSFYFEIVRDEVVIKTVEFPLQEQELTAGDYLNDEGIYKASTGEVIAYTDDQLIAFQSMTNLNVSKGRILCKAFKR